MPQVNKSKIKQTILDFTINGLGPHPGQSPFCTDHDETLKTAQARLEKVKGQYIL